MTDLLSKARFEIGICNLDNILTNNNSIIVRRSYYCGCNDNNPLPVYYHIQTKCNVTTYRDVLEELVKRDLIINCKHKILEAIVRRDEDTYFPDKEHYEILLKKV